VGIEQCGPEAIADRRAAGFSRQQYLAAPLLKEVSQQAQLRGLTTAVDPLEGNKSSWHYWFLKTQLGR
jgi:hypothetical protein